MVRLTSLVESRSIAGLELTTFATPAISAAASPPTESTVAAPVFEKEISPVITLGAAVLSESPIKIFPSGNVFADAASTAVSNSLKPVIKSVLDEIIEPGRSSSMRTFPADTSEISISVISLSIISAEPTELIPGLAITPVNPPPSP